MRCRDLRLHGLGVVKQLVAASREAQPGRLYLYVIGDSKQSRNHGFVTASGPFGYAAKVPGDEPDWPTAKINIARAIALESEPPETHLANGHIQIVAEVQDHAAIVVTTVLAFDFQH